ncbi:hypothetical protein ACJ41O_006682 [Fusarium nematophilum]
MLAQVLSHANTSQQPETQYSQPKAEVKEIASKGAQSSHQGGFASMDPDKQREIASEGGKASSGSFEPSSEKAKEAGRKGGLR